MKDSGDKIAVVVAGLLMTLIALVPPSAAAQTSATDQAMLKLARERNCMTCHAVDRMLLAPAFRDIAKRYAGQNGAAEKLTQSISEGSRGTWGNIPMPASPQLAPGEAERLAYWILGFIR
ncbi:Cytochrome c-551 [Pandoraea iniqua]|uniref:Cytochrome c-551 n=1 Tax=Pandoraea iniqua TaxID=2508288 RepID=A0A5E4TDV3_9BURK|nr:c-type cytochrome [Pandoraea iniqua]VVD85651.1 Cytochrome c-551 [Pandoraea iniqua]VVD89908.1 Cytochrome c-551 [Pandoraea iniqua]